MALPILAHWAGRSIFDIEPAALARRGIRLLLADLDNTLAPYGEPEPTQAVRDWAAALGEQGITLFVLSNNRHPERPRRFSQALGVPFLGHAGKPKPGGFRRAMEQMSCTPEQTAIVGISSLPTFWAGGTPGCSLCWWSLSAWRAIRGATCATERSGPSACGAKGGQNRYERNLRTGGQRRVLSI
ncbi:YqeG family HAD IIIA-type phosphatase [Flavonifractor plautii]|uniref:YqeG family HAD IIIA-type phosphatase n=1 Tax=Flavonifractor plautii TaxID=292800 RepID=UPI003EEDBF02